MVLHRRKGAGQAVHSTTSLYWMCAGRGKPGDIDGWLALAAP
ncbi:hypothetical protein K788_0007583 [Paraburkholderia caribensis MBA4]|uniref:Uncharacterized protein n=1 Tax=Paraburkholderia caribensis MBA4 TaxID=1323664 RepID=A0A0P0RKA1_9BURK|nr:hypothetical protein K788_0007583 [Paraburkholderia caribensis MBA4]